MSEKSVNRPTRKKAAKSIKEKRLAKKIKKVDGTNPETSK
jgi:hypothetical protein